MEDAERLLFAKQARKLCREIDSLAYNTQAPPRFQVMRDKVFISSAVYRIKQITSSKPFYDGKTGETKAPFYFMAGADLVKIRLALTAILDRWGVVDWPTRTAFGDAPLTLVADELELFLLVRNRLASALPPIESIAPDAPDPPSREASRNGRARLEVVTGKANPYFLLDGIPIACPDEVAVRFVAKLIEADGLRVSFSEWIKGHPEFAAAKSNRILAKLPGEIRELIESGKGRMPRLKIGSLSPLDGSDR